MDKETRKEFIAVLIINFLIGIYNIYLYGISGNLFNLIIGALNVGVLIFFRDYGKEEQKEKN